MPFRYLSLIASLLPFLVDDSEQQLSESLSSDSVVVESSSSSSLLSSTDSSDSSEVSQSFSRISTHFSSHVLDHVTFINS